ncbi:MAG: alpha-L-fucosidase [Ktedonobacteraceae bacterium]|nr:alpha-L-fucosidase [Ktedonobacteraceae bacterium]
MTKRSMKSTIQQIRAKHGLTRRNFLKTSAITTAAISGTAGLSSKLFFGKAGIAKAAPALDIWNLPAFTPASGTYKPDSSWATIAQQYRFPDWYRDAKYGIWAHWSPQSVPEYGDWYALHMYEQGTADYNYHLAHYGHPSQFGYKDLTHLFTGSQWDANALLKLYVQQGGAKYFMALANHHDNYDNWDSTYQPWNSQTVGRKSSIIGEWAAATRAQGIHFGVTYHACPGPAWGFFMPARYNHDKTGAYAGIPYDGVLTAADGKGKWWNGLDPQALNGPVHTGPGYHPKDTDPYVRQFYWRVDDLITKHKPDILYFDDSVNPTAPTGTATDWSITNQSYVIAANYYNKSLQWNNGKMDVVLNIKNIPNQALPALAQDWEKTIAATIQDYPWQAENSLGPWHYYAPNPITMSAGTVIHNLVNAVSKNGTYLINVPQHGDGHLDQKAIDVVTGIGNWLKINGEAIYGTRPFAVFGEGNTYYTRKGAAIYAIALSWPGSTLTLTNLKKGSPYLGNVTKVELLGHSGTLSFTQSTSSLVIHTPTGQASSSAYVFKVTQDKVLVNNDESGFTYSGNGWSHQANRGLGDSNNNIHVTRNNGDSVSYTFTGTGIQYITETYTDEGNVDVYIDGTLKKTVSAVSSSRASQVVLYSISGLASGTHTIKLVKRSGTYMLLDAFKVS